MRLPKSPLPEMARSSLSSPPGKELGLSHDHVFSLLEISKTGIYMADGHGRLTSPGIVIQFGFSYKHHVASLLK